MFSSADMYGYHGKRSLDFLRITMAMPRLIAPAKRLLEQGLKFGPFPIQSYQAFEANIDFEIRFVRLFQLCHRDAGDLLAARKMLILIISCARWCECSTLSKDFSFKSHALLSGLWWTLMWQDAAGLNFLKESIGSEKRRTRWTLILRTRERWANFFLVTWG